MAIRKTVFGSRTERQNYAKLQRQWANDYHITHNLPFLNVFDVKPDQQFVDLSDPKFTTFELSTRQFDYLKKTSVDYTLCTADDEPLVCIDFDGLNDGYNVAGRYLSPTEPLYERGSTWNGREQGFALKLRLAHAHMFPYFIVNHSHFDDVSSDTRITIVDGVIGEVLAKNELRRRANAGLDFDEIGMSEQEFDELDSESQSMIIEDWFIGVEVGATYRFNPIPRRVSELDEELGHPSCRVRFRDHKILAEARTPAERAALFSSVPKYGAECTIRTEKYGNITRVAWIPNFQSGGFSGLGLVEDIARLMALEALKRRMDQESHPSRGSR